MKILALTRYSRLGASSRLRMFQFFPDLQKGGFEIDFNSLLNDDYIKNRYNHRNYWGQVVRGYLKRTKKLLSIKNFDLLWIEKELFPFIPGWIEQIIRFAKVPYIVDYDDAIFYQYEQNPRYFVRALLKNKIDKIMNNSKVVIVGNEFLAKKAYSSGAKNVEIIPTVIDLNKYQQLNKKPTNNISVGWIGSPSTSHYLKEISSIIINLAKKENISFRVIGLAKKDLSNLPIKCIPWNEKTEVNEISNFDIGIMPLTNGPWEKGKCGYKLVQYMACGLPVIGSPIGVNSNIIDHGKTGYLASSKNDWTNYIIKLSSDFNLRKNLGYYGRKKVQEQYCLQVQLPKIIKIFSSII